MSGHKERNVGVALYGTASLCCSLRYAGLLIMGVKLDCRIPISSSMP